jgi:hypothetical protein
VIVAARSFASEHSPLQPDQQEPRGEPPRPNVAPLDYFSANAPDRHRMASVTRGWVLLMFGILPSACGVINSQATLRSGSPSIIQAHANAALLFVALGLLATIISLLAFWKVRDWIGLAASLLALLAQTGLAFCLYPRW